MTSLKLKIIVSGLVTLTLPALLMSACGGDSSSDDNGGKGGATGGTSSGGASSGGTSSGGTSSGGSAGTTGGGSAGTTSGGSGGVAGSSSGGSGGSTADASTDANPDGSTYGTTEVPTVDGCLSCSAASTKLNDGIEAARKANASCGSAGDCTLTGAGTTCAGDCQVAVSKSGEAAFKTALSKLDGDYCQGFVPVCGYSTPKCAVPTLVCTNGLCEAKYN
ncbi:MAG: hypothetical protein IPI67_06040 [Myxococcales bacterium]|nr:hypothetical protein [Myxococcales bacterium]